MEITYCTTESKKKSERKSRTIMKQKKREAQHMKTCGLIHSASKQEVYSDKLHINLKEKSPANQLFTLRK